MDRTTKPETLKSQLAGKFILDVRRADDHEVLGHGMVMYDARYAWVKQGQGERHTWNYPA